MLGPAVGGVGVGTHVEPVAVLVDRIVLGADLDAAAVGGLVLVALVDHVAPLVGKLIGDEAACTFAAQFYSSLGFGLSLKKAFEQEKVL